tara:strand:- start:387 stop:659 length:273 start_codon:yes stop_codon:yes gene_type:complete
MFDFIKRWIWGELDKDKIKKWGLDKIKIEEEEAIFQKKMSETPSFSKCVIPNHKQYIKSIEEKGIQTRSMKQKKQLRSYKNALTGDEDST